MLPTESKISSLKDLSRATTLELTDSEVQEVFQIITSIQGRYALKLSTPENLDALRDEVLTRLAEKGVLATFDPVPIMNGEPPTVEIIGKVAGDASYKYGHDHEKAQWEIQRANTRNEEVLGQKERINARRPKKKD